MNSIASPKQNYVILWVLCILGSLSVIPYIHYLEILPDTSVWKVALFGSMQSSLLFGFVCWLSYQVIPKTDLQPFPPINKENFLKEIVYPALIAGVLLGLTIFFFDKTIFNSSLLSGVHPPFWAGALASVYGAVNEEVLLRLFLFSFIYFHIGKVLDKQVKNRSVLWGTNFFVALIFGIGHLPAVFKITQPSSFEIFRVLFLNGIAGIVFGWLYWSRGLWTAIAAHFTTDLMIHVFLINLSLEKILPN